MQCHRQSADLTDEKQEEKVTLNFGVLDYRDAVSAEDRVTQCSAYSIYSDVELSYSQVLLQFRRNLSHRTLHHSVQLCDRL